MEATLETRETCFYCGCLLSKGNHEHDHFPIPQAAGGTEVVDCCKSCHDMKDRFTLRSWPLEWIEELMGDWAILPRITRIFIAKILGTMWIMHVAGREGAAE